VCLLGLGLVLLVLMRPSSRRAPGGPGIDEPLPEADSEPEAQVDAEPEAEPEPAESEPEREPEPTPPEAPVAAKRDLSIHGEMRRLEIARLREDVVARVERRPLFVMAEDRNVPYFRLFFMTKQELLDAILEAESVPPADVLPSPDAVERAHAVAEEALRRNEEFAAEAARQVG
jgi:hypothetical protein